MSSKFKKGSFVRQIMPAPIEGVVTRVIFDEDQGEFHYHVAVRASDGSVHDQSFHENAVEAVDLEGPPVLTEVIKET